MTTWTAYNTNDLPGIAEALIEALAQRRKVALLGEMGAGKTTFTKALCAVLGVENTTSSPTFSIINEYAYRDKEGRAALFHHLDLYRLKSAQEAFDIGIEDVLYDQWYCVIEWPQVIEDMLPEDCAIVKIEMEDSGARTIQLL